MALREFLGIHSFGINARLASDDGTLVNEHDESGSGQEEVYVVLDGTAHGIPGAAAKGIAARLREEAVR